MQHAITYAAVLLPHSSCQLQWRPKRSNNSIIIYFKLNNMLFTDVSHTFVVRAVWNCGSKPSHGQCSTDIEM
jgi:hypothetical protein